MPSVRRSRGPKLEPEVLDHSQGSVSLGGAMMLLHDSGRVSGASVSQTGDADGPAAVTVELCVGSRFTFARLVDLRTSADA